MIYLVYGNQSINVRSTIKKIVKDYLSDTPIDDFNFVKIDGAMTLVQEAVDECSYTALGCDKKVVVLENAYFLESPKVKNKLENEQNYNDLVNYIKNPNPDTCFIISVYCSKLDEKHLVYKALKEKAEIKQIVDPNEADWATYVKETCFKQNIKIDKDALMELTTRTNGNVALFRNELKKLILYTDHIRYNDVTLLVTRPLEDDAFSLFNYLTEGKINDALSLYRDLRVANVEPITLISLLANQFRLLNEVSFLYKKRISKEDIAKELNIKPGRVYFITKKTSTISNKTIEKALEDLYNLDLKIKSGQVDRFYAFELFLINFRNN